MNDEVDLREIRRLDALAGELRMRLDVVTAERDATVEARNEALDALRYIGENSPAHTEFCESMQRLRNVGYLVDHNYRARIVALDLMKQLNATIAALNEACDIAEWEANHSDGFSAANAERIAQFRRLVTP